MNRSFRLGPIASGIAIGLLNTGCESPETYQEPASTVPETRVFQDVNVSVRRELQMTLSQEDMQNMSLEEYKRSLINHRLGPRFLQIYDELFRLSSSSAYPEEVGSLRLGMTYMFFYASGRELSLEQKKHLLSQLSYFYTGSRFPRLSALLAVPDTFDNPSAQGSF